MNPLALLEPVLKELLYRIADEQMGVPIQASLSAVLPNGDVLSYTVHLSPNGATVTTITEVEEGDS